MNKHIVAPDKWVEVCAEISGAWLEDCYLDRLTTEDKNGDEMYTEEAQERFNGINDQVEDIISNIFEKGVN